MRNVSGLADTYRRDVFKGKHKESHEYKLAVYTSDAVITPSITKSYTPHDEAEGEGYPPGGITLTGFKAELRDRIATLDFDNPVLDPVTLTGRTILIYNNSLVGKDAVYIGDLGREITSVNGPWSPGLPSKPGATTSMIQW